MNLEFLDYFFTYHCKLDFVKSDISALSTDLHDCESSDVASGRNYSKKKVQVHNKRKKKCNNRNSILVQLRCSLSWCHSPLLHIPVPHRFHPRIALSDHKHCKSKRWNLIKFFNFFIQLVLILPQYILCSFDIQTEIFRMATT